MSIYCPSDLVRLLAGYNPRVSVNLNGVATEQALKTLFERAGVKDFVIDDSVIGTVTLTVQNAPFQQVLAKLTQAASPPLMAIYSRVRTGPPFFNGSSYGPPVNRWLVMARPGSNLPFQPSPPEAKYEDWWKKLRLVHRQAHELEGIIGPIFYVYGDNPAWVFAAGNPTRSQPTKPPLKNLYPFDWSWNDRARSLPRGRPPGIDNIIALEDGTLLVQGDPADVEELQALLQRLDIPIPSVECRLEVVRGKQKLLTATVAGKAGTVVKATNALTGPASVAARVEATFKILPLGGGRYEIESQGKVSVPLARRGARLEKTFQSTRELAPGQTLTLDRVEIGGETVRLLLTLSRPMDRSG